MLSYTRLQTFCSRTNIVHSAETSELANVHRVGGHRMLISAEIEHFWFHHRKSIRPRFLEMLFDVSIVESQSIASLIDKVILFLPYCINFWGRSIICLSINCSGETAETKYLVCCLIQTKSCQLILFILPRPTCLPF